MAQYADLDLIKKKILKLDSVCKIIKEKDEKLKHADFKSKKVLAEVNQERMKSSEIQKDVVKYKTLFEDYNAKYLNLRIYCDELKKSKEEKDTNCAELEDWSKAEMDKLKLENQQNCKIMAQLKKDIIDLQAKLKKATDLDKQVSLIKSDVKLEDVNVKVKDSLLGFEDEVEDSLVQKICWDMKLMPKILQPFPELLKDGEINYRNNENVNLEGAANIDESINIIIDGMESQIEKNKSIQTENNLNTSVSIQTEVNINQSIGIQTELNINQSIGIQTDLNKNQSIGIQTEQNINKSIHIQTELNSATFGTQTDNKIQSISIQTDDIQLASNNKVVGIQTDMPILLPKQKISLHEAMAVIKRHKTNLKLNSKKVNKCNAKNESRIIEKVFQKFLNYMKDDLSDSGLDEKERVLNYINGKSQLNRNRKLLLKRMNDRKNGKIILSDTDSSYSDRKLKTFRKPCKMNRADSGFGFSEESDNVTVNSVLDEMKFDVRPIDPIQSPVRELRAAQNIQSLPAENVLLKQNIVKNIIPKKSSENKEITMNLNRSAKYDILLNSNNDDEGITLYSSFDSDKLFNNTKQDEAKYVENKSMSINTGSINDKKQVCVDKDSIKEAIHFRTDQKNIAQFTSSSYNKKITKSIVLNDNKFNDIHNKIDISDKNIINNISDDTIVLHAAGNANLENQEIFSTIDHKIFELNYQNIDLLDRNKTSLDEPDLIVRKSPRIANKKIENTFIKKRKRRKSIKNVSPKIAKIIDSGNEESSKELDEYETDNKEISILNLNESIDFGNIEDCSLNGSIDFANMTIPDLDDLQDIKDLFNIENSGIVNICENLPEMQIEVLNKISAEIEKIITNHATLNQSVKYKNVEDSRGFLGFELVSNENSKFDNNEILSRNDLNKMRLDLFGSDSEEEKPPKKRSCRSKLKNVLKRMKGKAKPKISATRNVATKKCEMKPSVISFDVLTDIRIPEIQHDLNEKVSKRFDLTLMEVSSLQDKVLKSSVNEMLTKGRDDTNNLNTKQRISKSITHDTNNLESSTLSNIQNYAIKTIEKIQHDTTKTLTSKIFELIPASTSKEQNVASNLTKNSPTSKVLELVPASTSKEKKTENSSLVETLKLFQRLVHFKDEEQYIVWAIEGVRRLDETTLANYIVRAIAVDRADPVKGQTPFEPFLSCMARVLIGLILRAERELFPSLTESVLISCEVRLLFSEKDPEQVQNVTRFHAALCKMRGDKSRLRRLLCDSMYFMGDLAIPLIYQVLVTWFSVLKSENKKVEEEGSAIENQPLIKILIQVVHTKGIKAPEYYLCTLKNLLLKYYRYPKERYNENELIHEFLQQYICKQDINCETAILILCKNNKPQWTYTKIELIRELILVVKKEEIVKDLMGLIEKIKKQFPFNSLHMIKTNKLLANLNQDLLQNAEDSL